MKLANGCIRKQSRVCEGQYVLIQFTAPAFHTIVISANAGVALDWSASNQSASRRGAGHDHRFSQIKSYGAGLKCIMVLLVSCIPFSNKYSGF